MKFDFNKFKYIYIILYAALVLTIMLAITVLERPDAQAITLITAFIITITASVIPLKYDKIGGFADRKPMLISIAVFTLVLCLPLIGAFYAFQEFKSFNLNDRWWLLVLLAFWMIFTAAGIILNLKNDFAKVYKKYIALLLAGSVLELVLSIPLHLWVIKHRHGCFVGLSTMVAIACGFVCLAWALGPALLLFMVYLHRKFARKRA